MGKEIYEAYLKNKSYNDKEELLKLYIKKNELNDKFLRYLFATALFYDAAWLFACGANIDNETLSILCKYIKYAAYGGGILTSINAIKCLSKSCNVDKDIKQYSLKK